VYGFCFAYLHAHVIVTILDIVNSSRNNLRHSSQANKKQAMRRKKNEAGCLLIKENGVRLVVAQIVAHTHSAIKVEGCRFSFVGIVAIVRGASLLSPFQRV
jgi:hypothetical protein